MRTPNVPRGTKIKKSFGKGVWHRICSTIGADDNEKKFFSQ
jgi:hypothetical protein